LVDGAATVNAVLAPVSGPHVTAEIGTVNCDLTRYRGVGVLSGQGFADFVREDESCLVLNVKLTAELKRAMPFRAIHEDGDSQEDGLDRKLAAGEDGPAGCRKLVVTSFALEQRPRRITINTEAPATRAIRVTVSSRPTNLREYFDSLRVRHAGDPS
jgi:hypothetical protein